MSVDYSPSLWGASPSADPGDIEQCENGGSCPTGTFPWGLIPGGFLNIQLDIVGFLAILGEATVLNNGQVAALSWTCFLPRLIPAPQALIRTSRPERLDPTTGVVVGPHSGNIRRHVNHVAHILHQVAFHQHKLGSPEPKEYSVRAIKIDWSDKSNEYQRQQTYDIKEAIQMAKPSGSHERAINKRSKLIARFQQFGPLAALAYFGCALSIGLLAGSIYAQDGMSVLAVGILSLVSTLTGVANHWKLALPERTESRSNLPPSDVIISYPNGSFLVVTCPEEISRLYFQTEQCAYWVSESWQYRSVCLIATIMLMIGVICLANATQDLQVAWACCYIAINAAYWGVAALPQRTHWDMSSFKTDVVEFDWYNYAKDHAGNFGPPNRLDGKETSQKPTFTEALWKAIGITGGSHWARAAEIAPDTTGWDSWLREAEEMLSQKGIGEDMAQEKMANSSPTEVEAQAQSHPTDPERARSMKSSGPIHLPPWNYGDALSRCLKVRNRSRWSDVPHLRRE